MRFQRASARKATVDLGVGPGVGPGVSERIRQKIPRKLRENRVMPPGRPRSIPSKTGPEGEPTVEWIATRRRSTTPADSEAGQDLSSRTRAALPPRFEAVGEALTSGSELASVAA